MSGWAPVALSAAAGGLAAGVFALRLLTVRRRALSGPLHELRGALGAIQLGLSALEREALRSNVPGRVDALRTQAERAQTAVEDVDGIRLARHSGVTRLQMIDVGAIVSRRVAAWSGFAEARLRAVELRWPIGPALVRADPVRIGQALDNLIVNALDHGRGTVIVFGSLTARGVRIGVGDQGSGIARPLHEVIESKWNRQHGHGLAVAVKVAELHGGLLTATPGRSGSTVAIELPLSEPRARAALAPSRAAPAPPFQVQPARRT